MQTTASTIAQRQDLWRKADQKVAKRSGTKGGSGADEGRNRAKPIRVRQPPQVAPSPRTGIRLIPQSDFKLTARQRTDLVTVLRSQGKNTQLFLDDSECHVRQFLSRMRHEKRKRRPSDLRDRLLKIRGQASELLQSVAAINSSPSQYRPSSGAIGALLHLSDPSHIDCKDRIAQRIEDDLRDFISAIDRAMEMDRASVIEELQAMPLNRSRRHGASKFGLLLAQAMALEAIHVHSGAPPKAADRELIRNVLESYQKRFGEIRKYSPGASLHAFIQELFRYSSPADANANEKHRTYLIKDEAAQLKKQHASKRGR